MAVYVIPTPLTHTGAAPLQVDLNKLLGSGNAELCEVLIANLGGVHLAVAIGDRTYPLPAGVANVFPLGGLRSLTLTPRSKPPAQVGVAASSDLYMVDIAAATVGDAIPGVYPAVVVATPPNGIPLGTLTIPDNVSPNQLRIGRPPGVNFLRLVMAAGDALSLQVVGDQSAWTYLNISEPGAGQWLNVGNLGGIGVELSEAADTSLTISATVSAGHNLTLRVTGYASADQAAVIPRVAIAPSQSLTAASAAGQATVAGVPDTSAFPPGQSVMVIAGGGAGPAQIATVKNVPTGSQATASQLTLNVNLQTALAIGDVIVALPRVLPTITEPGTYTSAVVTVPATNGQTFTLQAANPNRRGLLVYVNSAGATNAGQTGIIQLFVGAAAGGTTVAILPSGAYWEMPDPLSTVIVQAQPVGASLGGNIVVTEIT